MNIDEGDKLSRSDKSIDFSRMMVKEPSPSKPKQYFDNSRKSSVTGYVRYHQHKA